MDIDTLILIHTYTHAHSLTHSYIYSYTQLLEQIDAEMGTGEPAVSIVTAENPPKDGVQNPEDSTAASKSGGNIITAKKNTRDEDILRKLSAFAACLINGARLVPSTFYALYLSIL